MPQPSESQASLQANDSLWDLLVEILDNTEESVRAAFLQQFFKSIARVDLTPPQSLDCWTQALSLRKELSDLLGKPIALKTAIVQVLASTALLRLPVLMEYEEFKKLQLNAATDGLTGLYNRRLFDEYCEKEFNRAQRYGQQLALVLLDLHRLKEVNDRYGHLQGDKALQLAAATLRKNLRASDLAFRIGGDEFALLLPQTDPEQSAILCDRLQSHFESETAALKLEVPVSIDYGIAVQPQDGKTKDELLKLADQRLYEHKAASSIATNVPQGWRESAGFAQARLGNDGGPTCIRRSGAAARGTGTTCVGSQNPGISGRRSAHFQGKNVRSTTQMGENFAGWYACLCSFLGRRRENCSCD